MPTVLAITGGASTVRGLAFTNAAQGVYVQDAEAVFDQSLHYLFGTLSPNGGMTDAIAYRGPDGEGYWISGHIGLGHRRLSIIDLSDGGKVIFGPAARRMPQLPITIDSEGYLVAQSDFQEPVGPSFWERG